MTGEMAQYGAQAALDANTGRASVSARPTYLVLLTAAPGDATTMSTMAEPATPGSNGYTRQAVAWSAPAGDPAETHNTGAITFGPFSADLAQVTHCALVSAQTGTTGDFIDWWALTTPRDPASGDSVQFAASALSLTCD